MYFPSKVTWVFNLFSGAAPLAGKTRYDTAVVVVVGRGRRQVPSAVAGASPAAPRPGRLRMRTNSPWVS